MKGLCVLAIGVSAGFATAADDDARPDPHSFSRPDQVRVTELNLSLNVDFAKKKLSGTAEWNLERSTKATSDASLVLDTRDLAITSVQVSVDGSWKEARFQLGPRDMILGSPLTIDLPAATRMVRIKYETSPKASALQWVGREGTFGKSNPFLYTQIGRAHV